MTKANPAEPPRCATWLLEQFSPVLENTPLTGDLIESFNRGRSSGWYWRQVLAAIVLALAKLLRRSWGYLIYAIGCGGFISTAWYTTWASSRHASAFPSLWALYAKGFGLQWPWSLDYQVAFFIAFQTIIISIALGAYLAYFRIWRPRDLLRTFASIIVVLLGCNLALMFLSTITLRLPLPFWIGFPLWLVIDSTPAILAMLLGMWNFRRSRMQQLIGA